MNVKPVVSVLMPVYNGERYLAEAIDSILNQTFKDFEFIIINDCSSDNTMKILNTYNDYRIHVINNEVNLGVAKSLNRGLAVAKGEYIARMDADDISMPNRLLKEADFLANNMNVGLLGTSWISMDEGGKELSTARVYSGPDAAHFMCHGSIMMRTKCIDKVGGYRSIIKHAQDYDLWLRLREICELANITEPLYKLRIHGNSISAKKRLEQYLDASLALDLAEERGKYGKDSLSTATIEEGLEIRKQKQSLKGLKLRKALSRLRCVWSDAAFRLGDYRRANRYVNQALQVYPLDFLSISILLKLTFCFMRNVMGRNIDKLRRFCFRKLYGHSEKATTGYWNSRAKDIDNKWGMASDDFEVLARLIRSLNAQTILEVGCGTGRLFPLYSKLGIGEVVGQDVSLISLQIARQRYDYENIQTTNENIRDLAYPEGYFDLIVSNRMLQHIPPKDITMVIKKLTYIGKRIYINEMSESDFSEESFYLFKHNYKKIFEELEFKDIENGYLGKQKWIVFSKI